MSNTKATFQLPAEKAGFDPYFFMDDQDGIHFAFISDMEAIARALPKGLEPVSPVVSGYVIEMRKPTFAKPYMEAMLGVTVKVGDVIGTYPFSYLLSGEGAEMATYTGRLFTNLPKKICDLGGQGGIRVTKEGNKARAIIERRGVKLLDISVELGEYNNPMAAQAFAGREEGATVPETMFFITPADPTKMNVLAAPSNFIYHQWIPGKASINLQSSEHDAWGQFPVVEILGGAYGNHDIRTDTTKMPSVPLQLDAAEANAYLLTARFDKETLM